MISSPDMGMKSCRVVVSDMEGVEHTVEVSASTLYEAIALGLLAIRTSEWTGQIPQGLNKVRVLVRDVPVEHTVTIGAFEKWLSRQGGAPRDIMARKRVQEILRQ